MQKHINQETIDEGKLDMNHVKKIRMKKKNGGVIYSTIGRLQCREDERKWKDRQTEQEQVDTIQQVDTVGEQ